MTWPLRIAAISSNAAYVHVAYRVRGWGALPRNRGATLIVANHQHDLETMTLVSRMTLQGAWRRPIWAASSRRMHEPGFMAVRLPAFRPILRDVNAAPLFRAIGLLPLENQVGTRAISGIAWSVQTRHGPQPLTAIFDDAVSEQFPANASSADLFRGDLLKRSTQTVVRLKHVREPYRSEILDETRRAIDGDLAAMQSVLESGGTIFLTAEGAYTKDGRMGRMRGSLQRLAPFARIFLAGVSYDPFRSGRFSMLYRLVELRDRAAFLATLAAIRPVTTSQLVATWLHGAGTSFSKGEAIQGVVDTMSVLPAALFVDPELRHDAPARTRDALVAMQRAGLLERDGERWRRGTVRAHAQFPAVPDIIAHQANFFAETLAGERALRPTLDPSSEN